MGHEASTLEIGTSFLRTMLGCPVEVTDDPHGTLPEFETANCFDPALQPAFTAAFLADHVSGLEHRTVHEVLEPLGLAVTLFRLDDGLVVVGPYAADALRAGEAETLLGRLRIPSAYLQPFKLYRARFAIVDSEYVMRAAKSLLALDGRAGDGVVFERVTVAATPIAAGAGDRPQSAPLDAVNERYALEQDYLRAVTEGNERAALAALRKMGSIRTPPSYLNTPYLGATILRILTRVAAQQSGLPPVTIDAISQTYAQRLHRSGHTLDPKITLEMNAAMIGEFCRQIKRYRMRPYSRLVRQAVEEIELHLSHNVSPRELAGRLQVSESHLARRFKAETGHTISEYLARERAARAAHLLATTNQPVRDIAAYVGYLDANYFVKVFKSIYDATPTAYRAEHAL
ncbi:helix-turn-helix transcriptional regulator [Microlunatus sp. GCM10028923]|uniref:helix-turn-helix transcriptional regulator n=1 Tax=Microlunatus sp. GCM10028923 TaxID=3273400 RepID=UPI00361BD849